MSLCKCQFIKAVPISLVLDRCWTHQLALRLVLNYPMQGCDEEYVQIDRFVLWAVSIMRKFPPHHSYAELEGCALNITANRFLPHATTWLLKKNKFFIQVSFDTSSITLENSVWYQWVTEALNKLRSAAKVEIREEGISQQVFEKVYQKKKPLAGASEPEEMCHIWAHLHFRHSPGSVITAMRLCFLECIHCIWILLFA